MGVGEQHALTYFASDVCDLRWLYDIDEAKARGLAHRLGAPRVAQTFDDILSDPDTHAVSIASYDDAHYDQVLQALNSGKHVFAEKPICQTTQQLRAIKQAWAGRGGRLKLSSNLVLRAAPVYQWLRQKIASGEMGTIYAFDGDYLYGRLHKITEGWRKDVDDYSVMSGGGVHLIDLLVWLTGERPTNVMATGNKISTAGTGFRYQDYVTATMKFNSGMIARITANFGCVHPHQHGLHVFGTEATFIVDDSGPRLLTSRDPEVPSMRMDLALRSDSKGALIPGFIKAIREDEDLAAETQSHFDVMSIIEACNTSLKTASVTEVEYV